jgi:hypothetical protein
MFRVAIIYAFVGAIAGCLLAVVVGGFWSAYFGQPFSGETGLHAFQLGLVFPGLILLAPGATFVGTLLGSVIGLARRRAFSRRKLSEQTK